MRARTGHGHEAASFAFKAGDGLYGTFECRTVDHLLVFGSNGVSTVPVAVSLLPGRGRRPAGHHADRAGKPAPSCCTTLRARPRHAAAVQHSAGYGFIASVENMTSRPERRQGLRDLQRGRDAVCPFAWPGHCSDAAAQAKPAAPVPCWCPRLGRLGRILTFEIRNSRPWPTVGRPDVARRTPKTPWPARRPTPVPSKIDGMGRGGKERDETLEIP